MHIGFDAKKAVGNLTGIGNYSRQLINALCRHTSQNYYSLFAPEPANNTATGQIVQSPSINYVFYPRWKGALLREYWRCHGMVKDLKRNEIDLFHGLSNELPWGIRKAGIPSVVTIHDLIFLRLPETYSWLSRLILKQKTRYACLNANRIIAISKQTKRDIMRFYHIHESKIDVVYQGCDPAFTHAIPPEERQAIINKYNLPPRYLLSVGTIEARKNHPSIVRTMQQMNDKEVHLVLVGKRTKFQPSTEELISQLGLQDRIHILNNVPNADLPSLYQCSSVFLYMSRFEGFGIPVLEALSSGVPVIAATGSCLEETGGPSSIYCDPLDYKKIAEQTDYVLSHPAVAAQMRESGKIYARNFSESRMSQRLMKVYRKALFSPE